LDRYWRKSRREEKELRKRRGTGNPASRMNIPVNTRRIQKQQLY